MFTSILGGKKPGSSPTPASSLYVCTRFSNTGNCLHGNSNLCIFLHKKLPFAEQADVVGVFQKSDPAKETVMEWRDA